MYHLKDINHFPFLETGTVTIPSSVISGGPQMPISYTYPANFQPKGEGSILENMASQTIQMENGSYFKLSRYTVGDEIRLQISFSPYQDFSSQIVLTIAESRNDVPVYRDIQLIYYPDSANPKIVALFAQEQTDNRWQLVDIHYADAFDPVLWDLIFSGFKEDDPPAGDEGGEGEDNDDTDDINTPYLPGIGILETGVWHPYACSSITMSQIMSELWDDNILTALKKAFSDPFDAIVSAGIIPINLDDYSSITPSTIKVGNTTLNTSARPIRQEWIEVSGGSCAVKERWGSFVDYNNSIDIYIPFCGTHKLDVQEVMNSVINLTYHINILTGDVVAFIKITKYENKKISPLDSVLYQFNGNCMFTIPLTGANYNQRYASMITAGAMAVGTMASAPVGGTAAAAAAGAALSGINATTSMAANVIGGSMKAHIQRSGSPSPMADIAKILTAYLIIHRDVPIEAQYNDMLNGKPAIIGIDAKWLEGYNEIQTAKLDGINCTDEERSMIDSLLKSGVFF